MLRAALCLLLLGAPTWAYGDDPLSLETEAYLRDGGGRYGMMAAAAGGGVKGWVNFRGIAWYPAMRGSGNDEGGGDFDLREDLGLSGNEWAVVPQLTVDFWIFGFRTDYFDVEFEGQGTLTRSFTFGGVTFSAGTRVASDVKIENFRSLGLIRVVDTDVVSLAAILGFNSYKYEATIASATGTATIDGTLPFPVIGALVQIRAGSLLVEAEVSGLTIDYSDVDATAIDLSVSVGWTFLKIADARVGYRYVNVDGTIEGTRIDLRLDGFFVAVGVTF